MNRIRIDKTVYVNHPTFGELTFSSNSWEEDSGRIYEVSFCKGNRIVAIFEGTKIQVVKSVRDWFGTEPQKAPDYDPGHIHFCEPCMENVYSRVPILSLKTAADIVCDRF